MEREESFDQTPHPWKGCALPLELFPHWFNAQDYTNRG